MYKGNVLETLGTSESDRYLRFIRHKTEKIKNKILILPREALYAAIQVLGFVSIQSCSCNFPCTVNELMIREAYIYDSKLRNSVSGVSQNMIQ